MPLIIVFIALAAAWYVMVYSAPDADVPDTDADWRRADTGLDPVSKLLVRTAQPLRGTPAIYERSMSPTYRTLQAKLLATGGLYSGSVEVFLTVQTAAAVLGMILLAAAMTLELDGVTTALLALTALILVAWPYSMVRKAAKTRVEEINETLPSFADLLQMPLSAGLGVLPAISFTVERIRDGVVKDEVTNMLNLQKSRAVSDAQAFMMAGERLGTAEAKAFFTALMQAHTQGMRVAANIEKQAEALRDKAFEQRREKILKLPTKISVIIAMHFMPSIIVVTMLPVALSLGSL